MRPSSTPTLSLKPAVNVATRQGQSIISLRLNGVNLTITCNLFLIIQEINRGKLFKISNLCCCIDRKKFTFVLSNLPVL